MKKTFPVSGMKCHGCASCVKDAIAGVAGVKAVEVDLASNSATVDYDEAKTKTSDLAAAVKAAGFELKD